MSSALTPEEAARLKRAMEDQWGKPYLRDTRKKAKWGLRGYHGGLVKPRWLRGHDELIDLRVTK